MRVVDVRDFCVPSDENDYDELVAFADTMASIPQFDAVPMSVIEDIKSEIAEYLQTEGFGSEYRNDITQIIDRCISGGAEGGLVNDKV